MTRHLVLMALAMSALCSSALAWEKDGLRLRGKMMTRYEIRDNDRKVGRWTDTFRLQQARIDGRWDATERLRLSLEFELTDGFELKDVFARYRLHEALRITAGHFKKPFSRLKMTSRWDLAIPERGMLNRHAIAGGLFGGYGSRDVGLMLSGRVGQGVRLRYFVGVFDGLDLQTAFFRDPDAPDEPNTSHRDYVGRLQLRLVKGLVLAASYCHKKVGILIAPGEEVDRSFNLAGGEIRFKLGEFSLQLEAAYGDNPNAASGHMLIGGHAIASYRIELAESLVLTPAFMLEILDADDEVDAGRALRVAGALNLDAGTHARIVLAAEGGVDSYTWETPDYITIDQMKLEARPPREVPFRILLQLNVRI